LSYGDVSWPTTGRQGAQKHSEKSHLCPIFGLFLVCSGGGQKGVW
jgi:hypothetical protein